MWKIIIIKQNTVFNPVPPRKSDISVDKNVACLSSLFSVQPTGMLWVRDWFLTSLAPSLPSFPPTPTVLILPPTSSPPAVKQSCLSHAWYNYRDKSERVMIENPTMIEKSISSSGEIFEKKLEMHYHIQKCRLVPDIFFHVSFKYAYIHQGVHFFSLWVQLLSQNFPWTFTEY